MIIARYSRSLHFSMARPRQNRVENFARGIFLHYSSFSGKSSGLIKMGWELCCVMGKRGGGTVILSPPRNCARECNGARCTVHIRKWNEIAGVIRCRGANNDCVDMRGHQRHRAAICHFFFLSLFFFSVYLYRINQVRVRVFNEFSNSIFSKMKLRIKKLHSTFSTQFRKRNQLLFSCNFRDVLYIQGV